MFEKQIIIRKATAKLMRKKPSNSQFMHVDIFIMDGLEFILAFQSKSRQPDKLYTEWVSYLGTSQSDDVVI